MPDSKKHGYSKNSITHNYRHKSTHRSNPLSRYRNKYFSSRISTTHTAVAVPMKKRVNIEEQLQKTFTEGKRGVHSVIYIVLRQNDRDTLTQIPPTPKKCFSVELPRFIHSLFITNVVSMLCLLYVCVPSRLPRRLYNIL